MIRCLRTFLPALDAAWRGEASSPWPPALGRAGGSRAPLLCSRAGAAVGLCLSRDTAGSRATPSCKLPRASLLTQAAISSFHICCSKLPWSHQKVSSGKNSFHEQQDSFRESTDVFICLSPNPVQSMSWRRFGKCMLCQKDDFYTAVKVHWRTCLTDVVFLTRISHWQDPTSSPVKPGWRELCFAHSVWPEKRNSYLCLIEKGTLTLGVVCSGSWVREGLAGSFPPSPHIPPALPRSRSPGLISGFWGGNCAVWNWECSP